MEVFLNRSKQKYIMKENSRKFHQLALDAMREQFRKDIRMLVKGSKQFGNRRKNLLRKCFIQWSIFYYERQL